MRNLLILNLILLFSCKSHKNFDINKDSVFFNDFGKICLNDSDILSLSKKAKINKRYLTSAFYSDINDTKVCFPVNDKTFDYNYWNMNKDSLFQKKINIYYKSYLVNNTEVKIIYNIAK